MLPLTASELRPNLLPAGLLSTPPEQLFPQARDPKAALAGLLLISGHWDQSHQVSQDIGSREGSYWHAIAHRIEPDYGNAGYWFRRVGEHPIYRTLHTKAGTLLAASNSTWQLKNGWDPFLFLKWCEQARTLSEAEKRSTICEIQRAEYELLFSWCALTTKDL
jgi:hypothetical protein